jgi:hypothetical protein
MFVCTMVLYECMKSLRNYVNNLFYNTHVRITIYREFYHSIIYIAKEGRYVRIIFIYVVWCQSVRDYRGNMEGILIEAKLITLHWFLISFLVFGRVRRFLFLCFVFCFFFLSIFIVVFFVINPCL